MNLRIAGIQMAVHDHDVRQNVAAISGAIEQSARAHADILLTPEGALSGYTPKIDPPVVEAGLHEVTALAREKGVGLALGTCYKESDGLIYNQVRFYTQRGEYLGFHSKILRCGTVTVTEPSMGEINHYATTDLATFDFDGITVGGLICNDMWANPACTPMPDPHLSQQLAQRGARIILHAVNGGRDGSEWSRDTVWHFHESNLRMRAAAGSVWIVTVDNAAPIDLPCSAPCGVIDPHGQWACRTVPIGEQFFVHTIEV
jgi:predicted amidohydrolase